MSNFQSEQSLNNYVASTTAAISYCGLNYLPAAWEENHTRTEGTGMYVSNSIMVLPEWQREERLWLNDWYWTWCPWVMGFQLSQILSLLINYLKLPAVVSKAICF